MLTSGDTTIQIPRSLSSSSSSTVSGLIVITGSLIWVHVLATLGLGRVAHSQVTTSCCQLHLLEPSRGRVDFGKKVTSDLILASVQTLLITPISIRMTRVSMNM